MAPPLRLAAMIAVLSLRAVCATAQVAEADRFIKLGTRLPLAAPGEGGQVRVTAWPEWCKDETYILEVRFLIQPGGVVPLLNIPSNAPGVMPVVRLPAGPSPCDWTFDDLPEGRYSASLQQRDNERVIATGSGSLIRGASLLMTLESAEATVEGRITLERGEPIAFRLAFTMPGTMLTTPWSTPVRADGTYQTTLRGVDPEASVCISLEADSATSDPNSHAIDSVPLTCMRLPSGDHRIDFDAVQAPPGVIQIEFAPIENAPFSQFVWLTIDQGGWFTPFKPLHGFVGQLLVEYGTHTLTILNGDTKEEMVSRIVTVGPDQRVQRVRMSVPDK